MGRLDGKTALITGGTSGIGLAVARLLVAEGAAVMINGRSQERVDRALAELPPGVVGVAARVDQLTDIDRLMAAVKQQVGALDILVLSAGVMKVGPARGRH